MKSSSNFQFSNKIGKIFEFQKSFIQKKSYKFISMENGKFYSEIARFFSNARKISSCCCASSKLSKLMVKLELAKQTQSKTQDFSPGKCFKRKRGRKFWKTLQISTHIYIEYHSCDNHSCDNLKLLLVIFRWNLK